MRQECSFLAGYSCQGQEHDSNDCQNAIRKGSRPTGHIASFEESNRLVDKVFVQAMWDERIRILN